MKHLPSHQRPREKLLALGPSGLTLEELFCVVFGSGTKAVPVEKIARGVSLLLMKEPHVERKQLLLLPGIGPSKSLMVESICEIGKRLFATPSFSVQIIRTTEDVLIYLKEYTHLKQEYLICLYLNARQELLKKKVVTKGLLTMNLVHPREVFSEALTLGATAVIIAHNHPSGSLEPSEADYDVTQRILAAGKILGVDVLDHILFSKEGWRSVLR